MKIVAFFFFAFVSVSGCKSRQGRLMTESTPDGVSTAAFFEGLAAKPGTPERVASADAMESAMAEDLLNMATGTPTPTDPEGTEARLMHRVVKDTISYLRGTTTCRDEERIILYRGFGRQPIFGAQASQGKGFMLNNVWMDAVISEIKNLRTSGAVQYDDRTVQWQPGMAKPNISGDYLGQIIFNNKDKLAFSLAEQDWKRLLEKYNFDDLARTHTAGEDPTILLSGSLVPEVANHFGPGVLKLAVCPQRALPVRMAGDDFYEFEVYIPFFILPEEIVSVDGFECGELKDGEQRKSCYNKTYSDTDQVFNDNTKTYRQCMLNFEDGSYKQSVLALQIRYSYEILDKFYGQLLKTPSWEEFMPFVKNLCLPSCDTETLVSKGLKEALAKHSLSDAEKVQVKASIERSQRTLKEHCNE
ncbi:MAG: hypothetical protein AB7T49_14135 [Oligoflexales bacterium]